MILFQPLVHLINSQFIVIDNVAFRLHYKATVTILIAFSLMINARQYFGEPINCSANSAGITESQLNTYCWIQSTFSVPNAWQKSLGTEVPYPGVAQSAIGQKTTYHAYYQWVWIILLLQAMAFYAPHYIWKEFEGGRIQHLVSKLNRPILKKNRYNLISMVSDYLFTNMGNDSLLYITYVLTEVLNSFNLLMQIFLTNRLLDGQFWSYGWDVATFSLSRREVEPIGYNPMVRVFPIMTKCTFYNYGASGDVVKFDALCVLSINVANGWIYLLLWYWYYILGIVSVLSLFYRAIILISPSLRVKITWSHLRFSDQTLTSEVLSLCRLPDWFLINLLAKNMDPVNFNHLMRNLKEKLTKSAIAYHI